MIDLNRLLFATLVTLAATAHAQASDLGISVSNYNPNADRTNANRYDWDWYWGKVPLQTATMTVGGQEYFEVGVANYGSSEIAAGTTLSAAFVLPQGMTYFAVSPPWSCAADALNPRSVACTHALTAPLGPNKELKRLFFSVVIDATISNYDTICATVSGAVSDANATNNKACTSFFRYFASRPNFWGGIETDGGGAYRTGQKRAFTMKTGIEHGDPLRQGTRLRAVTAALPTAFTNLAPPTSANPAEWNCKVETVPVGQTVICEKTLARDFVHGEGLGTIKVALDVGTAGMGQKFLNAWFEAIDARGVPVLLQRGAKYQSPQQAIQVYPN